MACKLCSNRLNPLLLGMLVSVSASFFGALYADLAEAEEKIARAADSLVEIVPGARCIEFSDELHKLYNNDALGAFVLDTEHRTALQEKHFRRTEEYQAHEKLLQAFRKRMESEFYCIRIESTEFDIKRKAFPVKSDELPVLGRAAHPQRWSGVVMKLPGAKRVSEGSAFYRYETFVSASEKDALAVENDGTAKIYARFRLKGVLREDIDQTHDFPVGGAPLLHFSANHIVRGEYIDYKVISKENERVYR